MTEKDGFSSGNCGNGVKPVSETDITGEENVWVLKERSFLNNFLIVLYMQMALNDSIHFIRKPGDVGLRKNDSNTCGWV